MKQSDSSVEESSRVLVPRQRNVEQQCRCCAGNGPAVFAVTATYDPFNRTTTISNEKHFVHFTDASGVLSVTASSPMPTTVFNNMSTTTIIIVCVAALILIALIIDIIALFVWRKRGQYSELNCKIWAFKYDKRQKLKVYTRRVRSSIRMSHN